MIHKIRFFIFLAYLALTTFLAEGYLQRGITQDETFFLPTYGDLDDVDNFNYYFDDDFDIDTLIEEYRQGTYDHYLNGLYETYDAHLEKLQNICFEVLKEDRKQPNLAFYKSAQLIQYKFQEELCALKNNVLDPDLYYHLQLVCDNFLSPKEKEKVGFDSLCNLNLKSELTDDEYQMLKIYVWHIAAKTTTYDNKDFLKNKALISLKMFDEMQKVIDASDDKERLYLLYNKENFDAWKKNLILTQGWIYLEKVRSDNPELDAIFNNRDAALFYLSEACS